MDLLFYNCSSLSSLPDISKWNTKKVTSFNLMFAKCASLISIPDISKWKTKKLKEMNYLFSDCFMLLFPPNISNLNNNFKDDILKAKPDYNKIKNILNFTEDIICFSSSLGYDLIFEDNEVIKEKIKDKYKKFND